MFKKAIIFILICSTLVFSGCSGNKETSKNDVKRTELTMAISSEPDGGFDPTTGWGRYGSPLFQSTILKRDSDMKIVNDLATEYTVSSDGLVWTVKIRKDVKFSDGKPLTAADIVFTYETTAKSSSVVDLSVMEKVEAIDNYTVKFTLKNPQSTFVNILSNTGIVPKHAYGKDYSQKPVGSGPFKFVQWDKGQQLIVEANPEYYGDKPFFKKITFLYLSEEAAFAAAQSGTLDIAAIVPSYASNKVSGMHLLAVDSVDNRGIMFPYVKPGKKTKDGYPVGNEVTSDISIRKAINKVVDRKALVDGILNGYGSPAYTVCDKMPWWNPETVIEDADSEEAKKILSNGGWKDSDNDGILDKGNIKAEFKLIYPSGDQTRQSLAIAVADKVKDIGIKINVEGKSWDDIKTQMYSNAIVFGWGSHDPIEMYNLYNSKYMGVDYFNSGHYSNPTVDDYLNKAIEATDETQAIEYWKKAQWDGKTGFTTKGNAPWAWLVNLQHLYLVRDNLNIGKQKIHPHGHGWPLTDNIAEWVWKE
ncbi:ABC transporter substrate-binding protein [Pseudobacteroides cellulosolvens]|uniref:ABC-type transporter, periplasmic subunit n=1 Tax=Pseudobacteroides cellulosolvens ATCC 35603 = DSM 2933 TaxID=398512 RepID=A0A0L6JWC7_9FIRM|nr:ABC transporter substrate-binding protein [Pseudobacteroides cellulosolvens]KNY30148.1 ABC-type transporter, periplasmic subunit [Pseudobacteroides cellulosolvens ATCC 35603 = DSM 2933]